MSSKTFDQMTREERVAYMLQDSDAYIESVPEGHWLLILDGLAKLPPYKPEVPRGVEPR
jgi:hypothetical protein